MNRIILSSLVLFLFCGCIEQTPDKISAFLNVDSEQIIQLDGEWQVALDPGSFLTENTKVPQDYKYTVQLPGTLSENKIGEKNKDRTVWKNLSLEYEFAGLAFYKRTVSIPKNWDDRRIVLRLERTRKTSVWLDGKPLGTNLALSTAQVIEFPEELTSGEHELIVAVDNVVSKHPGGRSHMNEESTQTNWNGIVGKLQLEATPQVWIEKVRVFPNVENRSARFEFDLCKKIKGKQSGKITVDTRSFNSEKHHVLPKLQFEFTIDAQSKKITSVVEFGDEMLLWDEFDPALYRSKITLALENGENQKLGRTFGMRLFTQNGSQFVVNKNTTFLRGKHDACVFPLTGYAPMDVEEWVRILNIAKEYGINHYRFHTWCPPEAALAAADLVGIYMQPELPCWGELDAQERGTSFKDINAVAFGSEKIKEGKQKYNPENPTKAELFFNQEAERILDDYGNYASFVMFAIGNELKGNKVVMQRILQHFHRYDNNRRLYCQGSNNNFRTPEVFEGDDYFTTVRSSEKTWDAYENNTRISFSAADQFDFGLVNHLKPSTRVNFSRALETTDVPVIGHETGQYCYYPDYNELDKYTGVSKPWNYNLALDLLKEKGMYEQWPDFFKAAGKWASILYCEDMESGIRTPGFGGFQLLDLQDYPGQGTALVGPLNAFMESKGTITPAKWREFCAPVTLLAEFDEYTLTSGNKFVTDLVVSNYGKTEIKTKLNWELEGIKSGSIEVVATSGQLTEVSTLKIEVPELEKALRTNLNITLEGTDIRKSYPLWVYPKKKIVAANKDVLVSQRLDSKTITTLNEGGKVLLIPNHNEIKEQSVGGLFMTEFWSYLMFKTIAERKGVEPSAGTLGLLIDEKHPALKDFPTEFHSNWQWWSAVKNSRPIILDDSPKGYKPIVQTIDNMWRSHKLGTLFECKVGKGKLFVSAIDLPAIKNTVEGNALYHSIVKYLISDEFNPTTEINLESLNEIIYKTK